jgi:hypothetical protein
MTVSRKKSKIAYLDLNDRGYEVSTIGSDENNVPLVVINMADDEDVQGELQRTEDEINSSDYLSQIDFPAYKGYNIVTATIFKYTLVVCFEKQ